MDLRIKLDGYRAIAVKSDRSVTCFLVAANPSTTNIRTRRSLHDLPEGTVVDGEVVALDDSGRPTFNLLQQFRSEASRIHYFVFDLLVCHDRTSPGCR